MTVPMSNLFLTPEILSSQTHNSENAKRAMHISLGMMSPLWWTYAAFSSFGVGAWMMTQTMSKTGLGIFAKEQAEIALDQMIVIEQQAEQIMDQALSVTTDAVMAVEQAMTEAVFVDLTPSVEAINDANQMEMALVSDAMSEEIVPQDQTMPIQEVISDASENGGVKTKNTPKKNTLIQEAAQSEPIFSEPMMTETGL